MTASRTPGFYWARRGRGKAPIVLEVHDVSGELWVRFMGSYYILDLAEAEEEFEILQRIPEPEPPYLSDSATFIRFDRTGNA
jgi:hypothetical protein